MPDESSLSPRLGLIVSAVLWTCTLIWFLATPEWEPLIGLITFTIPLSHYLLNLRQRPPHRSNRQILISNVRFAWIHGILENSLHEAARIDLRMDYKPDAVRPWGLDASFYPEQDKTIPLDTPIDDIFHRFTGSMLILGAPGSGKTITLLDLAKELLNRADDDIHSPIPVILNLSSWARKRQPITEWLVEEMFLTYGVNREFCQQWITEQPFYWLLDGLDEVAEAYRDDCVRALNTFMGTYQDLHTVVVCSRHEDYERLTELLAVKGAVMIRELTHQQVDAYLAAGGEQLAAARLALNTDALLRDLATSPLILNIIALTYKGKPVTILQSGTLKERRNHLFEQYTETMLHRRPLMGKYDHAQCRKWLSYLAAQLVVRQQTVFHIEDLQPDWLPHQRQRFYFKLISICLGIILGSFGGWLGSLYFTLQATGIMEEIVTRVGNTNALILGWGILGGAVSLLFTSGNIQILEGRTFQWPGLKTFLTRALVGALGGALVGALGGALFGALGGALVGALGGALFVALFGALAGALEAVIVYQPIRERTTPNEGIWQTGKESLFWALFWALFGALFGALVGALAGALGGALVGALAGALGGALGFGGESVIKHFIIRFLLSMSNYFPNRNLVPFLNDMVAHLLLNRTGGSYVFIHRMLLEYLATQWGKDHEINTL